MLFETSEIFNAIKEKTAETPSRILTIINSGKEKVDAKNDKQQTYFHLLAHSYEKDEDATALVPVVFQLSNAGLDVNAADTDGNTALHVAAKTPGSRRLIRAFIMVGMAMGVENLQKQTPVKLAKPYLENAQVLKYFETDLWNAVKNNAVENVEKLLKNWCKVNQHKDEKSLIELSNEGANVLIKKQLIESETTNEFVHYCLAGDRSKMRPFFKKAGADINPVSSSFIDNVTGDFVSLSLLGEVALLGLNSVVRKLLRKNAKMETIDKKSLFLFVLERIAPSPKFYEIVALLADKVEFSKNSEKHVVLDAAYEAKVPIDVLRVMTANGLDIFAADEKGHFLRDRILIKHCTSPLKKLGKELAYVDDILIDMAKSGCTDLLTAAANKCYDYLDVTTDEHGSVRNGLAKTMGVAGASAYLTAADKDQHLFREILRVIEIGHLPQLQKMLTPKVFKMTDRVGRTMVHKAVLFERRHVLRHMVNMNKKVLCAKDDFGRTALFYACLGEDSEEIINSLKVLGCKMDDVDKNGDTPNSVMDLSAAEKKIKLVTERTTDYGIDTYLFFKYLELKEAIREGNQDALEEVRAKVYKDLFLNDLMKKMYQTNPPQRCILQFAIDAKRDTIAKYLLTLGMNWDVTYQDGDEEISLLEAAACKNMDSVVNYIQFQMEKQDKYRELLKKLRNKGVIKNSKKKSDEQTTTNDIEDGEEKSGCILQ